MTRVDNDPWVELDPMATSSIAVILTHRGGGDGGEGRDDLAVPVAGGGAVDLQTLAAPADEQVVSLLESSLSLVAPRDVPESLVETIGRMPVPPAFRVCPWLRRHRALVLDHQRTVVGEHVLEYAPETGLQVLPGPQRPRPAV